MGKKIIFEREIEFRREPKVIEERKFTDESGAAMFGIILGIIVTITELDETSLLRW